MRFHFRYLPLLVCWFQLTPAQGAHTTADLILEVKTAQPGETVMAGIRMRMEPGWHTYWKNPGGSGMATEVKWELPAGISAGPLQWPGPEKLPEQELTTYIYHHEVVLLVPLQLAADLRPGPYEVKAEVSWLECEVQCIPGDASVQAVLRVDNQREPDPAGTELLQKWLKALPPPADPLKPVARWENAPQADLRTLLIEWQPGTLAGTPDFFPEANEDFEVQPETAKHNADPGTVRIAKKVKKLGGDWPKEIPGLLVHGTGAGIRHFAVTLRPDAGSIAGSAPDSAASAPVVSGGLLQMLLYAFIGGVILNIMPCVLPVIALKILGFVSQARDEPRRVRFLGFVYGIGVLVSFLVLAGLVIGVKAAGQTAGWGMQFGNPQFLVILTVLVTLVALNLFGLFEITPGSRVMNTAGQLASKHGPAGAFFNGVLATVLATPCTAPFLGAALGFAFAQPPSIIILVFLTVGLGLAFPYVLLSWNPAWLKFLPKPGPWMENFKVAMGFPMLATAFWLFSLIPLHYGDRSWWLGLFLTVVAFAAWIYGKFVQQRGSKAALGVALVVLLAAYVGIAEAQLKWRAPSAGSTTVAASAEIGGLPWQPWSPEAVSAARADGRPVLVDFTAKWCLTCNTIVKPALESQAVRDKVKEVNALPLLGDYTRFPKNITEELNRYGRAGVPLVLVFPGDPAKPALVLPEAITPGMVVDALTKAAL